MNATEFRTVLLRVSAIEPAYHRWVESETERVAASARISQTDAYNAMRSEWLKAVEPYTTDEINAVLDDVAGAKSELPSYSKLWRTLAGYAADARSAAREAERHARDGERRLVCLTCEDRGYVDVYNPRFVAWVAPRFVECQAAREFPKDWYRSAASAWYQKCARGEVQAPAELPLVCCCKCQHAIVFRRQLERMRDYMANPQGKPVRAAYIGQYDPQRHCLRTFDPHADLTAWFDEHPPVSDEWAPQPGDYERNFA